MSGERIMIVEDDDGVRKIAVFSLERLGGYQVCAVSGGREAVAQAKAFRPDLFVLDVAMPEMDGPSTLIELRKSPDMAQVPAVFLTASTQPRNVSRLLDVGALDVIAKPFDPKHLCERVAAVLAKRSSNY